MNLFGQIIDAHTIQYPNRRFKIINSLGKGAEGVVYLSEPLDWIENQVPQLVLKFQSQREDISFLQYLKTYQQQNESWAFASPSGMIKIYDIFEWNQFLVIAMEVGSTDLFQYIQQNYTDQEALQILLQLSYSVRFLHSNNLIHRDLKPENYIKVGDKFKLIDFGLVQYSQRLGTPNFGSPLFQAPEIVNNQQYSIFGLWGVYFSKFQRSNHFANPKQNKNNQIYYKTIQIIQKDFMKEQNNQLKINSQQNYQKE